LNALPANPTVNDLKTELQDLANQTQNYCQKLGPADPNQASCNALAASLNHLLSVLNSTVDPFGLVPALPGGLSLDKQTVIDNAAAYCSAWANRLDCNGNGNIDPSELAALDALMGHNGGGVATLLSTAQKTVDQLYASGQICPDKDKCPNIPGIQKKVPDGYVIDASGMCVSIKGPWTNEFDETITAQCPPGEVGSTNTVTIKAGTVTSTISQEDANNQAAALSRTQAIAGLQCTVANSWTNDAESIEAFCPAGTVGDPQTGYVNQGEVTSTISQKDADAKALALALSRAEAQLQCVVDVCPNIAGAQAAVPAGMTIDSAGDCVPACDCDQGQAAAVSVAVSVCTCGVSSKQLPASSLPESSATESNL
jgi:hypothetical protein